MEPKGNNATGKITTALIIGLLVGFTAGMFWQERRGAVVVQDTTSTKAPENSADDKLTPTTSTDKITKAGEGNSTASTATIVAKDQPASDRVEIERLDTKEIVWVAVREEKDGVLGNILGAQRAQIGDGQKVVVELLRPTVSGGAYRVVLYKDVGTPAFNYQEDMLVSGVETKFKATE